MCVCVCVGWGWERKLANSVSKCSHLPSFATTTQITIGFAMAAVMNRKKMGGMRHRMLEHDRIAVSRSYFKCTHSTTYDLEA